MTDDPLRDLIMEQSPEGFWSELKRRQDALYREAHAYAHHGALWEAHDALAVFPIVRRAVFESALRSAARSHGLKPYDLFHDGDNYSYVLVKKKKLVITCHHVSSPDSFVRPAKSRKQNAAINEWLDYFTPRELLLGPLPELRKSGKINLYILHGQQPANAEKTKYTSFLRIAIPNSELTEYQRTYDVQALLNLYAQRDQDKNVPGLQIADRALPRIKKDGEK
ncbi:MAG: hypothetical protein WCD49_14045 [Candidatus Acidiferrales bacterium]